MSGKGFGMARHLLLFFLGFLCFGATGCLLPSASYRYSSHDIPYGYASVPDVSWYAGFHSLPGGDSCHLNGRHSHPYAPPYRSYNTWQGGGFYQAPRPVLPPVYVHPFRPLIRPPPGLGMGRPPRPLPPPHFRQGRPPHGMGGWR